MRNVRTVQASLAGLVISSAILAGCGEPTAVPANDEFAGNSGQTSQSQEKGTNGTNSEQSSSDASQRTDTGVYKDGTYDIKGQYGPVGEDSIDVSLTLADGTITAVAVEGHPFTSISKNHQQNFIDAVNEVVVGKPLKGLHLDTVAGASWTTDAFNKALDVARSEASTSSHS